MTDPTEAISRLRRACSLADAQSSRGNQTQFTQDIRELLERLDRAEVNARRYEWLRDKANMDTSAMAPMAFNAPGNGKPVQWRDALCGEKLDAAIDQAMKGKV